MAQGENFIDKLLGPELQQYFYKDLKHKRLTPIQSCTLKHMLENFDCVVQSPTGSGKTLAYLLPTLQILQQKKVIITAEIGTITKDGCQILALVLAPGRELVIQIAELFEPICKTMKIKTVRLYGAGGSKKKRIKDPMGNLKGSWSGSSIFIHDGQMIIVIPHSIVVSTPGRLESLLEKEVQLKNYFKHLEVLIIDEADRYSDRESQRSLTSVLSALSKQRRTALFSATQATSIEQLVKFGLRNPIRLNLSGEHRIETNTIGLDTAENGETRAHPEKLANYYACVPAEMKLLAMIKFLKSHKNCKILVFVSNASQAEYFALIMTSMLAQEETKGQRKVLSLHRKKNQKRESILEEYRRTKKCILFTTDLLARGIDVLDIDWVLQYDIPKLSQLFIHRSGRSARMGREGNSLLLLMEEESAYVEYMRKHEQVEMEQCTISGLTAEKAEKLRERVQQMAIDDRRTLELGSSAFVSYIEAYSRHDCQVICKVKELNAVGVANAFALLRLPRIREFQGRQDLRAFRPRHDVRTAEIRFKNERLEAKRQEKFTKKMKSEVEEAYQDGDGGEEIVNNKRRKRKGLSEWDQLQREEALLKKFRKGKLTKAELNEELDELP